MTQNVLELIKELSAQKEEKKMTSITVKKGEKLFFVKLEDISHFQAEERYVKVHAINETYLTEESLLTLVSKLPRQFIRIHRSTVINKDFVNDIQKYFNSRFIITLNNKIKTNITSGRSYNTAIKSWIEA